MFIQIGSNRCQTADEDVCLIPQLGSGPDTNSSGSGFLTVQDYKDILNYAKVRHIEIIPEIDMPGHARAAIMAMEARYRNFNGSGQTGMAEQYRLVDPLDDSKYLSVQNFNDNAINPCIESTYSFIEKVVMEIKNMHDSVGHPLKIFHFGGDEVSKTAWTNSTACMRLNFTDLRTNFKRIFTERVANITLKYSLNLAGWEDGFIIGDGLPFDRQSFLNNDVFSNAWNNVWEWGEARRAYNLANAGYKVLLFKIYIVLWKSNASTT
jgi:hexosaminidase